MIVIIRITMYIFCYTSRSAFVKVDHDVLNQPPRDTKKPMIDRGLVINVLLSALIIITGTLYVFKREMSDQVSPRCQFCGVKQI